MQYQTTINSKENLPWVAIFFLTIVFFFAYGHNVFFSVEELRTVKEAIEWVDEGSIARRISILCLFVFGSFSLLRKTRKRLRINGFTGWLIIFFLFWVIFSIAWASDTALAFRRIVLFVILCIGAFAIAGRFSVKDIIFLALISASVYLIVGFTAELALGTFRPFSPGYRFSGTLHTNSQGLNCTVLFLAAVSLTKKVNPGRNAFVGIAIVALIFLILTKSRTSFASAMLALFIYWNFVLPAPHKYTLIFCAGFILCLLLLFFSDSFISAFRNILIFGRDGDFSSISNLTGRIQLWEVCLSYIKKHPILGYGYGSFWTQQRILEISEIWGNPITSAHSGYLEMMLSFGIFGTLLFLLILLLGIKHYFALFKLFGDARYLFALLILIVLAANMLLESRFGHPSMPFFISLIILSKICFIQVISFDKNNR